MKVYFLRSGYISFLEKNFRINGGDERVYFPVPFYLIEHGGKYFLFDTGNPKSTAAFVDEKAGEEDMVLPGEEYAVNALKALGVTPDMISTVIMSHLHNDHAGALGEFKNAEVIVRRAEFEFAMDPSDNLLPHYSAFHALPEINWHFIEGDGLYDVCGDGAMVLLHTPGHTPGHQSLMLTTEHYGRMLIMADACYEKLYLEGHLPLEQYYWNGEPYLRQLEKFRAFAREGVTLIPGHDPEAWESFAHAPKFYD